MNYMENKKYLFVVSFYEKLINVYKLIDFLPKKLLSFEYENYYKYGPDNGEPIIPKKVNFIWMNNKNYFSIRIGNKLKQFHYEDETSAFEENCQYLYSIMNSKIDKIKEILPFIRFDSNKIIDLIFSDDFIKRPEKKEDLKKLTQKQISFLNLRDEIKEIQDKINSKNLDKFPSFSSLGIYLKNKPSKSEFETLKKVAYKFCSENKIKIESFDLVSISTKSESIES